MAELMVELQDLCTGGFNRRYRENKAALANLQTIKQDQVSTALLTLTYQYLMEIIKLNHFAEIAIFKDDTLSV